MRLKLFLFSILFLLGRVSFSQPKIIEGYAQGTSYKIIYYSTHLVINKSETDLILAQLDSSLSIYKPYSLISRFNQDHILEIEMDHHLAQVVSRSFYHWEKSNGFFDITIGPLSKIYRNNSNKYIKSEIIEALKLVGMNKLKVVNNKLIKLKRGVQIDVNGIAQGYSVDVLADFLESKHIENYLVELGGEIKTKGIHADGRKFNIAIETPVYKNDSLQLDYRVVPICNTAITTSGTSKRHHINPKNGKRYESKVISATVMAETAMDADALDNYIIAWSPRKNLRLGYRVFLSVLHKKNKIKTYVSQGFDSYICSY